MSQFTGPDSPFGQKSVVTLVPEGAGKLVASAVLTVGSFELMVAVYHKKKPEPVARGLTTDFMLRETPPCAVRTQSPKAAFSVRDAAETVTWAATTQWQPHIE